jgi:HK97 family phage portal protein
MLDWMRSLMGASVGSTVRPSNALTSAELARILEADGAEITARNAIMNSSIFRCVNLISGSMGQLPIHLMRADASGAGGMKATDHPLYKVLAHRPNNWQSPSKFKRLMQYHALMHGNAYALPIRVGGRVSELIPLVRGTMRVEQESDWSITYIWSPGNGKGERKFKSEDIFHLQGLSEDGVCGVSMVKVARDVIGLARKTDASMKSMMNKGMRPGGALSTEGVLSDEAASRLKDRFSAEYSGAENDGKWMVLEQGLKAQQFSISAKDSQSVESRNQLVEEVARFFGVPRPLMMMDDTSWGSGIEQLAIFYVVYALGPWFKAWEEEIALKLLTASERDRYYAKVNERALLRGSMKDQAEYITKLVAGAQVAEANEMRGLLDMAPHVDGVGLNSGMFAKEGTAL